MYGSSITTFGISVRSIFAASAAFLIRLLLERLEDEIDDPVVEVAAAQERVAAGGEHLEDVAGHLQHRDVERAAAQVVDQYLLIEPAVEPVGERRSLRLVDDPLHVEARQQPRLLHRVALVVVVVGGHRDHRLLDRAAQELLGDRLHVAQDEAADLGQRVHPPAQAHRGVAVGAFDHLPRVIGLQILNDLRLVLAADQPLGAVDRVARVGDRLVLRHAAHQHVALRRQRDHRRKNQVAAIGRHHLRDAVLHRRDERVGGAEVDSDDARLFRHEPFSYHGKRRHP
jgi:hypothetical protein